MKIALAQINSKVGDLPRNEALHAHAIRAASDAGVELLVFPEMSMLGYPPRDLVARSGVEQATRAAVERVAQLVPASMLALIGLPIPSRVRPFQNALALVRGGRIECFAAKQLLPSYDVFDEDRHFFPGTTTTVLEHAGERIAAFLCEDLWQAEDALSVRCYAHDPVAAAKAAGATLLAVASASPFVAGKDARHLAVLRKHARAAGVPVVSVNAVGGQDDLVFDGGSRVIAPDGRVLAACARFREDFQVIDLPASLRAAASEVDAVARDLDVDLDVDINAYLDAERFHACVLGTRDYLAKTGHTKAIIGLSGGIDSALVAAIASAAIGSANVTGLLMPSNFSSQGSIDDATDSARVLSLGRIETLPIASLQRSVELTVLSKFSVEGVTHENLQSRARGLLVMLASNATGALVLTTGNKSEYATGYATLYGDMNGGLAPIGDLYKTEVYAMSRMLNARFREFGFSLPPIPQASIDKVPSAELRLDQTDQDSLPPYEVLDAMLRVLIDDDGSLDDAAHASGAPMTLVREIATLLDRTQYKRDQAAVILKLSPRAFGRGRRFPLAGGSGR